MTKHKEKGTVTSMRNTERAVKRNAVNPSSLESSERWKKIYETHVRWQFLFPSKSHPHHDPRCHCHHLEFSPLPWPFWVVLAVWAGGVDDCCYWRYFSVGNCCVFSCSVRPPFAWSTAWCVPPRPPWRALAETSCPPWRPGCHKHDREPQPHGRRLGQRNLLWPHPHSPRFKAKQKRSGGTSMGRLIARTIHLWWDVSAQKMKWWTEYWKNCWPCSDRDLSMSPQCIWLTIVPSTAFFQFRTAFSWLKGGWEEESKKKWMAVKEKRQRALECPLPPRPQSGARSGSTFNKAIIFDEGYCRMGDNTRRRIKGRPQKQASRELFQAVSMLFAWWFPSLKVAFYGRWRKRSQAAWRRENCFYQWIFKLSEVVTLTSEKYPHFSG